MTRISCSIGVFAHNEADNMASLLEALLSQKLEMAVIEEIIVVSSASTDGTDAIVAELAGKHERIRLLTQKRREGKSSAINLFLREAKHMICVIISGDVVPAESTIERLVKVFQDEKVGACGGRPLPVNTPEGFMGYAVHLLWKLHHRMAMISPKLGEMIAFRKVMEAIPADSAVDEASIEAIIRKQGLKLLYVPEALIHNKGPENLKDFIKQRRRIQNGHLWLKAKQDYQVVSQDKGTLLKVAGEELKEHPGDLGKIMAVGVLEIYCRLLGSIDYYIKGKNPFVWEMVSSTKNLKQRRVER